MENNTALAEYHQNYNFTINNLLLQNIKSTVLAQLQAAWNTDCTPRTKCISEEKIHKDHIFVHYFLSPNSQHSLGTTLHIVQRGT